ncbi:jg24033 [Pararge aegeria aegeria]|uniref:Jg24033 protein n=2 Tax=Pararge aegeria TaxID=116150 RepID=A0A8S4R9I3_9NEOP|nr:jg24033 [Pararge aegeria aegeria]
MEVEPVSFVRDSTRNLLKINRRKHRDEESDLRRSLKEISITSEDIASIANKLKTKPAITAVDLRTLKNGLINDVKHCAVFLNVNGALRGLVRELTGLQVDRQCAAAGCCCNLALGDARVCTAVAKAAGSYLVAALDNLTVELAVTCAWALGNLAGSGNRVCSILAAQGAVSKLSDYHANQDLQVAAIYALLLFAYEMKDELKPEHLQKILQTLSKLELTSDSLHLLFILSCHEHFAESMKEELLEKLLKHLPSAIEIHNRQTKIHYNLIYILRVLANSNTITNEDKQFTEKEVVE